MLTLEETIERLKNDPFPLGAGLCSEAIRHLEEYQVTLSQSISGEELLRFLRRDRIERGDA